MIIPLLPGLLLLGCFALVIGIQLCLDTTMAWNADQAHNAIRRDCKLDIPVNPREISDLGLLTKNYITANKTKVLITCSGSPWECSCSNLVEK